MKREWRPDELIEHWTILPQDRKLLGNKSGATRLGFIVLWYKAAICATINVQTIRRSAITTHSTGVTTRSTFV